MIQHIAFKTIYSLIVSVWTIAYLDFYGPKFIFWFCCLSNYFFLIALWSRKTILFSMAALSVFLIQGIYILDFICHCILSFSPSGTTNYMFNNEIPFYIRCFSLFHIIMPFFYVSALMKHSYVKQALLWQSGVSLFIFSICFFITPVHYHFSEFYTSRVANINYIHGFGPIQLGSEFQTSLTIILLYFACNLLPAHLLFSYMFYDKKPVLEPQKTKLAS